MNNVKKIVLGLLTVCALSMLPKAAYASTLNNNNNNKEALYTIEVASEEEYQQVIKDIEEHNKISKALWEKAVKENEVEESKLKKNLLNKIPSSNDSLLAQSEYLASAASAGTYSMSSVSKSDMYNGYRAYLNAYVTYYKVPYLSTYTFGTINTINIYGEDSGTTVSSLDTDYTKIDGSRTLAVNASYVVGVKQFGDSVAYYSVLDYIEFYTDGTGYWY